MKQIRYGQIFRKIYFAATIGCLMILCFSAGFGQTEKKDDDFTFQPLQILKANERLERPIKKHEGHPYTISLKRGELVHIKVEHKDVALTILISKDDAEKKTLKIINDEKTTNGTKDFVFMAESDDKYFFGVINIGNYESEGRYILQNNAPFATLDEKDAAADELSEAGNKASQKKDYQLAILYHQHAFDLLQDAPLTALKAETAFNLANDFYNSENYSRAIELYQKAAPLYHELNNSSDEGLVFFNTGGAFQYLKDYEKSTLAYQKALTLLAKADDEHFTTLALSAIGNNYASLRNYEKSNEYLGKALEKARRANDKAAEGSALYSLGGNYFATEKFDQAVEFYLLALPIFRGLEDSVNEASLLSNIGLSYGNADKPEKAFEYLDQALKVLDSIKNPALEASTRVVLGSAFIETGRSKEALNQYEKALKISRSINDKRLELAALRGIGNSYGELGEYENSLKTHQKVLDIAVELKDDAEKAATYASFALIYMELGRYEQSFDNNFKALENARRLKNKYNERAILNNIGVAYLRLGSLKKAEEYILQSEKLSRELNEPSSIAVALTNLGTVYARLKQYDKAVAYFEEALPLLREQKNYRFIVTAEYYYGMLRREKGELERAVALHKDAVEIARQAHTPKFEARSQIELGLDYLAQNKIDLALPNFQQALVIAREVKAREEESAALDGLMRSYNRLNQKATAIFYGKQSINLLQETRGEIVKFDKETKTNFVKDNEQTYRLLAEIMIGEGRLPEAQQVLAMLKEEELSGFVRRDAKEIENLAKRADLRPNERTALEKYTQFSTKVTQIGAELAKLEESKRQIKTGEIFAEQARYDELTAQLKDANTAFRVFLEKELAAELGREKKREIEADRALQGKLKDWGAGTIALSTVIGEDRYRVILTTSNAQIDGKTEIKSADLNAKIFAFREALLNPTIDPKPLGKELYDVLIKPVEKDLEAANAKTLLWSLDGTLRYIPIAALWDGNQYLVQKYQNVIVTSTTRQSLQAEVNKNWQILGAGVTKASEVTDQNTSQKFAFDELKSVAKELTAIVGDAKNMGKGVSLLDAAFTEKALKTELTQTADERRKFNVVHFATHFRLGSDTADSFLLLGNNQALTLAEVADSPEMNLNDVELVTLSACNTGFGGLESKQTLAENNGKEVDSLAQFIELRGAKSVMATLWSVADESTAILMGEFYKLRKENTAWTKAETLRQAQLELLYGKYTPEQTNEKNRSESVRFGASAKTMPKFVKDEKAPFAHPFYWSPFVLIGNWR